MLDKGNHTTLTEILPAQRVPDHYRDGKARSETCREGGWGKGRAYWCQDAPVQKGCVDAGVEGRHSGLSKGGVCDGMFPISSPPSSSSSFQEASLPCTAAAPHFISEHLDLSKQEEAAICDVYTFWELGNLWVHPFCVV